jgi:hypothetical protein
MPAWLCKHWSAVLHSLLPAAVSLTADNCSSNPAVHAGAGTHRLRAFLKVGMACSSSAVQAEGGAWPAVAPTGHIPNLPEFQLSHLVQG